MKRRLNKGMKEQKEMTSTKYRDNHKEEAKEYHKGFRGLEKSKERNLNKARKNIMKGTNLTYLLKQNSNWENVRFVIVKIKVANLI